MTRLLPAVLALLLFTPGLSGQDAECFFESRGRTAGTEEGGVEIIHFFDPFVVVCTDGAELRANQGRLNRGLGELYLAGNVLFQDTARTLTSNEATYNSGTARLWATGNVVFTDRGDGTTIRGPELEYFRATEDRPLSRMTATRRPTVTVPPRPGADPGDPLQLVADRVVVLGDDDLSASGTVVITRPDLHATSAEARYLSTTESLELRQDAVIRSEAYELGGEIIRARLVEGALEYVHSQTAASLRGEDLEVTAPDLQLFFAEDQLQRAVARGDEEALADAFSRTFRIRADSLDAALVDQQLELVHAVGRAFAVTVDTATADARAADVAALMGGGSERALLRHDWIRGDTIIGYFEPSLPAEQEVETAPVADAENGRDPAERPSVELRRLHARGSAQSLYRLRGETDPPGQRSNINFLVGQEIELELAEGELQVAQVTGLQQGVYLEAAANGAVTAPAGPSEAMPLPEQSEPEPLEPDVPSPNPA
jgi:lipopolysaccharide export system protein LptA